MGIYIFAGAWFFTVILGYIGYSQYYELRGEDLTALDLLYDTLQLFTLKGGDLDLSDDYVLALDIARWTALIVFFWAMALLLSRAFLEPLWRLRLWLCSDHIIVCGLGKMGSRYAKTLSDDYQVVIIDQAVERLDDVLEAKSVIFIQGDPTEEGVLLKAGVRRAKYLIPALGDDGRNAEVAVQARQLVGARKGDALTCFLHVLDPVLCHVLRVNEFNSGGGSMRLEFYSVYEIGARAILNEYPAFIENDSNDDVAPRMMVVGLDDASKALVV